MYIKIIHYYIMNNIIFLRVLSYLETACYEYLFCEVEKKFKNVISFIYFFFKFLYPFLNYHFFLQHYYVHTHIIKNIWLDSQNRSYLKTVKDGIESLINHSTSLNMCFKFYVLFILKQFNFINRV